MISAPAKESRHKCLIYDGHPSEQLPVIVPLLIDGLQENRRCLYLGDPDMIHMVDSALQEKEVDTAKETKRGALIFSSDRSYLDNKFDPAGMVEMLSALIDDAVRDGFSGLCATGDMMWELGNDKNFELLLEYEALLEKVFREKPLKGICQYRRDTLSDRAIKDAMTTHQSIYMGGTLTDNLFYMPPELLLDKTARDKHGKWMCDQIVRVLRAEEQRDRVLAALTVSEAQQRRLAEDLAANNRDLERRVRERTAALENANKELESFAYSASHDLRAPLRSLRGFSQALIEDFSATLDEQAQNYLTRIQSSAEHMTNLVDNLLNLSRIGRHPLRRERLDFTSLVKAIVAELQKSNPNRHVEWIIAENMTAGGDVQLLRIALTNLLDNAWKYTSKKDSPKIEVGMAEQDNKHVFFIRDNGAGFDLSRADQLFSAFHRFHSESEFPGTGIGLATVKRIIDRHEGRIWATAIVDEGATFYFTLGG